MTPYLEDDIDPSLELENGQVFPESLPTLATLEYAPLERNLLKADLIWTAIFYCIAFIVALCLRYIFEVEWMLDYGLYIYLVLAVLVSVALVYVYYEFKRKSYAIRQKDIIYNNGLFWQSSIVVPFNRVQHCEVSQGPIDRYFGLAELKVFTAGGASSDLKIDGLSPETAQRIKDFIVHKTGLDEEE